MWLNTAERLTNFCSLFTGKEAVTFFTSRKLCLDVVNLRYFNNSLVWGGHYASIAIKVPLVSIQSAHTMLLYDAMNLNGPSLQQ